MGILILTDRPLQLVCGKNVVKFGVAASKKTPVECSKQLNGLPCGIEKGHNIDGNVDSEGLAHEVSEVNKDSIRDWNRGHFCHSLEKNLTVSFPCPKNLDGNKLKIMNFTSVSSSYVQKITFQSTLYHPPVLIFFLTPLPECP